MTIHHRNGAYEVRFLGLTEVLRDLPDSAFVITDRDVFRFLGSKLAPAVQVHTIKPGEASKSPEGYLAAINWLATVGAQRDAVIVALGGGVVGDLAGFVAATYMRGVALLQIPTTLLAQVDSSVGGKVGVDLPQGKNMLGAFHPPVEVRISTEMLESLSPRQFANGMAEVLKYGFIMAPDILELANNGGADARSHQLKDIPVRPGHPFPPVRPGPSDTGSTLRSDKLTGPFRGGKGLGLGGCQRAYGDGHGADALRLESIVRRCIECKREVVEADELETTGRRAILNFGHTIGHALEVLSGYSGLLHGEAISIGMCVEAALSERLKLASPGTRDAVAATLADHGLPTTNPMLARGSELVEIVRRDKKSSRGRLAFSLLRGIGKCELIPDVAEQDVLTALGGS